MRYFEDNVESSCVKPKSHGGEIHNHTKVTTAIATVKVIWLK
ncbi:hypothetical protein [Chamaesiphon sp. VAR_48_metabat_403]|nr:hypothetical protein [Chamaesiphon sp. VAR_48_metabat_403]